MNLPDKLPLGRACSRAFNMEQMANTRVVKRNRRLNAIRRGTA